MKSEQISPNEYKLTLLVVEMEFLQDEAKDNNVTVEELIDLIMGLFFMQGYKTMFGME